MSDNTEVIDPNAGGSDRAVPTVIYAEIDATKPTVYIGPRKSDQAPLYSFHYGDGNYLQLFHYVKNNKASVRGVGAASTNQSDGSGNQNEQETKK